MAGPLDFEPEDDAARQERLARREDPDQREQRLRPQPPPPRGPSTARYGWFLLVAAVVLIVIVTINGLSSEGPGARGIPPGEPMPPFAAPIATSDLAGDVNVARKAGQGEAGDVPACSVRGKRILNVCELYEEGPVVLAFFASRGEGCVRQLDVIDDVAGRFPGVRFAAVSLRGNRDDVADLVRERGWGFPVGFDRDGVTANLYGVAVCPQIVFARRGGAVVDTTYGEVTARELIAQVGALEPG